MTAEGAREDSGFDDRLSRRELVALTACGAVAVATKLLLAWHYRIDSDEPQHLHVVWAWTRGLLPYRDVFDNHTPLFHLLMAPIFAAIGERSDIITLGRLFMVPLWLLAIGFTYVIARAIDPRWRAAWGTMLVAALPIFTTRTTEFRTDDLWTVLCLAALMVLVAWRSALWRMLLVGILVGLAFTASMKTTLFLAALVVAWVLMPFVSGDRSWRVPGTQISAGLLGLLAPPVLLTAYFWHRDAIGPLWYGVIEHNVLADDARFVWPRLIMLAMVIAGVAAAAQWMSAADPVRGASRGLVTLVAGAYLALVVFVWPARTPQTFLPVLPLVPILLTSAAGRCRWTPPASSSVRTALFVTLFAIEAAVIIVHARVWRNDAEGEARLIAETLELTSPSDYVFDFKGETIFRRRPYYLVFESFTRRRLRLGLLRDDVADKLIETRTCVTVPITIAGLERTAAFISEHYVSVGNLLVAGVLLKPRHGLAEFDVPFPAPYIVVDHSGPVAGRLDGISNSVPRLLSAGHHVFMAASDADVPQALIWGPAAQRGFSPRSLVR